MNDSVLSGSRLLRLLLPASLLILELRAPGVSKVADATSAPLQVRRHVHHVLRSRLPLLHRRIPHLAGDEAAGGRATSRRRSVLQMPTAATRQCSEYFHHMAIKSCPKN